MCKDSPLPPSPAPPSPQEPSSTLASSSQGCRQLIQELQERLVQSLKICQQLEGAGGGGETGVGGGGGPGRDPLLIVPATEDK